MRALGLRVEPDLDDLDPSAVSRLQESTRDLEVDRVEDDLGDRLETVTVTSSLPANDPATRSGSSTSS